MQHIDCTGKARIEIDENREGVVKRIWADGFVNVVPCQEDRDGKTIKPWDVVYGESDGKRWTVVGIGKGDYSVIGKNGEHGKETYRELKPEWLTHEEPDNWWKLYNDAISGDAAAAVLKRRAERLIETIRGGGR